MNITFAPLTVAFARQELRTLMGCTEILGTLRLDIERASEESEESGRLRNWCDALLVVTGALSQSAENLNGAIKLDEARATPTDAAAE